MAARRSEHAVRHAANEVASRADAKFMNKRQGIEAERKALHKQMMVTNMTAPPSTKDKLEHGRSPIKPGQHILVAQDLLPGKFLYGGDAWVHAVHGTGVSVVCDVQYIKNSSGNRTRDEKALPLSRLTVKNCAWHKAQLTAYIGTKRGSKRCQQEQATTKR